MIAEHFGLTREALDAFALESHRKAAAATDAHAFESEIVALDGLDKEGNAIRHETDQGSAARRRWRNWAS